MYDFEKLLITKSEIILSILNNNHIKWKKTFDYSTGNINDYPITGTYKCFKFKIASPTYLLIEGSLHKYHKNTNEGDFTFTEVSLAVSNFCSFLGIDPCMVNVLNLEFGVNIKPIVNASKILKQIISYLNRDSMKPLDNNSKAYIRVFAAIDHFLKLYDKGLQLKTINILRLEIKGVRSRYFEFAKIKTLKDLLNRESMLRVGEKLIKAVRKIVFDDDLIDTSLLNKKELLLYNELSNPRNWTVHKNHKTLRQIRKEMRFKSLILRNGANKYNETICKMIFEKVQYLAYN